MARKIIPIVSVIFITVIGVLFLVESSSIDREELSDTFSVDALYYEEQGFVEISFVDESAQTEKVILEILGMSESYQKSYLGSEFTERVEFSSVPTYGWKTNPITLVVEHAELGKIGIKTEIHSPDEASPPIIFSKLD